jgi:hypothetical protein
MTGAMKHAYADQEQSLAEGVRKPMEVQCKLSDNEAETTADTGTVDGPI